jgi:hypothetical protein
MTDPTLTDFERELLDAVSVGGSRFGVATDCVEEELLESSPGREAVEETLRSLVARGLMRRRSRGQRRRPAPARTAQVASRAPELCASGVQYGSRPTDSQTGQG